jgi:hypothetical protein
LVANPRPLRLEEEEALAGMKEEMIENAKLKELFPEPTWL